MEHEFCETGLWVDEQGRVVDTPPVTGTQLVAPGGYVDAERARAIARARANAPAEGKPQPKKRAKPAKATAPEASETR